MDGAGIAYRTDADTGLPAPLESFATWREPIKTGESGATIERLGFDSGPALVLKRLSPERDWMMAATGDSGRAATLWVDGTMERLPPMVDPALVRIERANGEWLLYMHDLTPLWAPAGTRFPLGTARQIIEACAALHATYWGEQVDALADVRDLVRLCAPESVRARLLALEEPEREPGPFFRAVLQGWEAFKEMVPLEIGDAVFRVLEQPSPLVGALEATGTTLCHSDPHLGNVVPTPERVYFLDWSLASQAPPAVDFCWFLDLSARFFDAPREVLLEEFRRAEGEHHSEVALRLAMLLQVALNGWAYGRVAIEHDRQAGQPLDENVGWWVRSAAQTLEKWWPGPP